VGPRAGIRIPNLAFVPTLVTGLKNLLLKLKVFWKGCLRKSCVVEDDPEKQMNNDINRDLCNWCGSGNEARLFCFVFTVCQQQ
jgi:hypothetical protein